MAEPAERLFHESGASWYWVLSGPASALAMMLIGFWTGSGFQPVIPLFFLVLVTAFVALQVKAVRIHSSVELTRAELREGTEITPVADIAVIYPEAEHSVKSRGPLEKWQTARTLGELSDAPRGRTTIGLKLTDGRTVQAWARDHRALRAALTPLVESGT